MRKDEGEEDQRDLCAVWRKLNQDLFKEAKKWQFEVAGMMGVKPSILSTMLGGEDRLSLNNLKELLRCHIQLEGFKSPAKFQEWLDILRFCPGYRLEPEEVDRLREVAEEEFKMKGIVTEKAVATTVYTLYNEVRALSKSDFKLLEDALWNGKFQRLLNLFEDWRRE